MIQFDVCWGCDQEAVAMQAQSSALDLVITFFHFVGETSSQLCVIA